MRNEFHWFKIFVIIIAVLDWLIIYVYILKRITLISNSCSLTYNMWNLDIVF